MKKTILAVLVLGLLVLAACKTPSGGAEPKYNGGSTPSTGQVSLQDVPTQELKKFNSVEEIQAFLSKLNQNQGSGVAARGGMMTMDAVSESAPAAAPGAGKVAQDYSQTNTQYVNIDEGDFVKNDGQYIYMIAENKLIIIDGSLGSNADIISATRITDEYYNEQEYWSQPRGKDLFVNGNKLILFVEANEPAIYFPQYDVVPQPSYRQKTYVYIYDVTDRKNPQIQEQFEVTGSYFQSRMIENIVYVVTQEPVQNQYFINEPVVESDVKIVRPDIYYFDNPDQNYQFNTISSFNVETDTLLDSESYMLGYANTLMVSDNAVYIAYQKSYFWSCRGWICPMDASGGYASGKDRFKTVILPRLPSDLKSDVSVIVNSDDSDQEQWIKISDLLKKYYEEKGESAYRNMVDDISDALEEYDVKQAFENTKTIIQKVGIDNGRFSYKNKGEVYGRLLNQYSMDEFEGNLRIATTIDIWTKKQITHNNVYVLDEDMQKIGELAGLAPDEQIYSTRFMGEKLFMVTFKRIDPFFVIDLKDPTNPKVAGQLKLPGFSDYLHPYDENHIIGIGKDTENNDWGGVSTTGVKVALFDVSNINNPKLVDSVTIGDAGSDSPALHDPHAFLFSKSKNMLVLPLTEVTQRERINEYQYSNSIWNGAYVFTITSTGITEVGKVKHDTRRSDYYDWWSEASVVRSLYMDDTLFTISNKYVKVNDLSNNLAELTTINLPYNAQYPYYWR